MIVPPAGLLQRFTLPPLRVSTILLGFSVPISVALDNLLLAIILLGMLFNTRDICRIVAQHPVARAAWLLFGMLFFAMVYGVTPLSEAAGILGKYIDLVFVPLFMLLLAEARHRQWAQYAFLAAMGLTLLLSYLVGLYLLSLPHWMGAWATPSNPAIFHSHITQNNMMAFAVFLALLEARDASAFRLRMAWGAAALLGAINVLFMVQGRTGYLILLALLGWFLWTTLARHMRELGRAWGWRQGALVVLVLAGLAAAVYQVSPRLHERVALVAAEYQAWQPNQGANTSIRQRLDFYYNSLQIVYQHPVFGVGTGGLKDAYARQTQAIGAAPVPNPHNEYLMIMVQTGVIGLILLLYLFFTLWREAERQDTSFTQDAARGLVLAYMVNCTFNSALLDHGDGLFFAFMTAALFAGSGMKQEHG